MTTADPTPTGPRPQQIVKKKRGSETAMDMVRSLGLIAAVVAVTLIFVPSLVHPGKSDRVHALDYSNYLEGFRSLTGHSALAPTPVPDGWRANSADLTGPQQAEHLRIGFVTPDEEYAGLVESVGVPATAIRTLLGKPAAAINGHVEINGADWDRRTTSRGEPALTRTIADPSAGAVTVIVTGSASVPQLQALAASLR